MIRSETDLEKLFRAGAADIIHAIQGIAAESPSGPIVWGLCGGRSPVPLFALLVKKLESLPPPLLKRFRFMQVDERLFDEFNQTALKELFIDPLVSTGKITPDQFLPVPLPSERNMDKAGEICASYENTLRDVGGRFHIVLLGAGEDGHVAGTFPKHPSTAAENDGFFVYKDSPKPPPGRITATLPLLAKSAFGVLIVTGKSKAKAMNSFFEPDLKIVDCPAKIVQEMEEFAVLTDQAVPI